MAFISLVDIQKKIRLEEINQITRNDDTIVIFAIDAAISEMKGYLSKYYDVNSVFQQTGSSRNSLLVDFAIDIAIYNIISTCPPGQDVEDRIARYERAIKWLKGVAKGEITTDLPPIIIAESVNKRGTVGEHAKRDNYF
jgi:phage gp36-like protein